MNVTSRWWDVAVFGGCLGTLILIAVDESPRPLPVQVIVALAIIAVAHLVFGHRALRQEDTPGAHLYSAVLIGAFALGVAGSMTMAVLQTVIYPVLWAMSATWWRGVQRTITLGVALAVGAGLGRGDWVEGAVTASASVLFSIAVGSWIMGIARHVEERDLLLAELRATQEELAALERQAGQETERAHVAREIHDTIAQSLTGLVMVAQRASREVPPEDPRTAENLAVLTGLATEALGEARALVACYGGPGRDAGLATVLRRHIDAFRRETGVAVRLTDERPTTPPLTREQEVVLLRCAQESLANVRKHSRAANAVVHLGVEGEHVVLTVTDDGVGLVGGAGAGLGAGSGLGAGPGRVASTAGSGTGIPGMTQRVALAGGEVAVKTAEGGGTRVRVTLPLGGEAA